MCGGGGGGGWHLQGMGSPTSILYVCSWNISFMLCNYILQNLIKSFQKRILLQIRRQTLTAWLYITYNLQMYFIQNWNWNRYLPVLPLETSHWPLFPRRWYDGILHQEVQPNFLFRKKIIRNLIFNTWNYHVLSSTIYRRID